LITSRVDLRPLIDSTAQDTLEGLIFDTFPHPHSHLAAVCMHRLAERGFQRTTFGSDYELEAGLRAEPFLDYAYSYWLTHARKAQGEMSSTSRLETFVRGCHAFPISFFFPNSGPLFDVLSPLHVVAYFNLPLSYAGSDYSKDPNPRTRYLGVTPLCLTPWRNSERTLQELLGLPNTLVNAADRYGHTALIWASKIGLVGFVRFLLAHQKIKVNQADQRGWAALLWASRHGHERVVQLLLSHPKIQVNQSDSTGTTALIRASLLGNDGVVRLLLSRPDIDVNQTELASGSTALIQASEHGRDGVLKLLLAHPKTNVNIRDREGRTALIWAICVTSGLGLLDEERKETVRLILSHPCVDITTVDKEGRSAHQWASQEGRLDILELLQAHYEMTTPISAGSSHMANPGHVRVSQALDSLARRALSFGRKQ
jgi:ankyrin repeat protein